MSDNGNKTTDHTMPEKGSEASLTCVVMLTDGRLSRTGHIRVPLLVGTARFALGCHPQDRQRDVRCLAPLGKSVQDAPPVAPHAPRSFPKADEPPGGPSAILCGAAPALVPDKGTRQRPPTRGRAGRSGGGPGDHGGVASTPGAVLRLAQAT